MNPMIYNKMNTQGDLILDETMLQMPIKRSKELQDLLKLKLQEKKLVDQFHNKARAFKQSRALQTPKKPQMKSQKVIQSVQKELKMNQSNSSYVVSCVLRALRYRKLAIDDVADIFGIDAQTVEEIDRFRRMQQLQYGSNSSITMPNMKFDMKKDKVIRQLQMKFKNNSNFDRFGDNSSCHSQSLSSKKSNFSLYDSRITNKSNVHTLSNYQLSSIIESAQKEQQEQNLFEYQKLLKKKPPHKLDDKVKAIVQILKKHPNIMQKEIIQILAKDYNITNMTQTSISRYYKKIYEMRKHCQVLLQAKKDWFIDI